jgi:hypothetical protein
MESQMLGFFSSSRSSIALAAMMALMVSTSASFAAERHHRLHNGVTYEQARPSSRAHYAATFSNSVDRSNECIGGFRYMRHIYDANRSPAEDLVPLPCH